MLESGKNMYPVLFNSATCCILHTINNIKYLHSSYFTESISESLNSIQNPKCIDLSKVLHLLSDI